MLKHLVSYRDSRVDGFFTDSTIVVLHGSSIDYYSETGVKATIKATQIINASSLSDKISQLLKTYNKYSQTSQYFMNMIKEQQQVVKTNKITQLLWGSNIEQSSKTSYRLFSLDRTAYVEVNFSCMLMKVSYLLEINDQCLVDKVKNEKNITKDLLIKYNLEYQEYPEPVKTTAVGYKYIREEKVYVLNKVPERWQYPLSFIWNIIRNKLDFKPIIQPLTLIKSKTTCLPKISFLEQLTQQIKIQNIGAPVFRYPRHSSFVNLMISINETEQNVGWIQQGQTICFDGEGYWILNYESLHLKFSNTLESQKIYNINAIPLIVRANNNNTKYQRNIKDFLISVYNASTHQPLNSFQTKIYQIQKITSAFSSQTTQQSKQIHKIYNQYGVFSMLSNHLVTAKFNDGIFIIANFMTQSVKIKDKDGNSLTTNLNDKFYYQYLKIVAQCYQSVYYPEEFHQKNQVKEQMQSRINFNESLVEFIGSGDYLKKTHSESMRQDYGNIQEIMRKNEEILKKLEKYK